jgi:hypothetical protein
MLSSMFAGTTHRAECPWWWSQCWALLSLAEWGGGGGVERRPWLRVTRSGVSFRAARSCVYPAPNTALASANQHLVDRVKVPRDDTPMLSEVPCARPTARSPRRR